MQIQHGVIYVDILFEDPSQFMVQHDYIQSFFADTQPIKAYMPSSF